MALENFALMAAIYNGAMPYSAKPPHLIERLRCTCRCCDDFDALRALMRDADFVITSASRRRVHFGQKLASPPDDDGYSMFYLFPWRAL